MQRAFGIEGGEQQFLDGLNQERQQALAQYGALSLEMEQVRKNLEALAERQRSFVRQALMHRGVTQFESARINGTNLEYTTTEAPAPMPAPSSEKGPVNGSLHLTE